MTIFRSRWFAIFLTVVVIIGATLVGVGRSLNGLARDIEAMFYDGVFLDDQGFTQPSIDSLLNHRANTALVLGTMLEGIAELAEDADTLLTLRRDLLSANSLDGKFVANENMQRVFIDISSTISENNGLSLSERDYSDFQQLASNFNGAQTAIMNNRYNQMVTSFMDDASFFAHLLRPFVFVNPPEYFGRSLLN